MCYGCWEEYGFPLIRNEKIEKAVRLIRRVYGHNLLGGNLHVIVYDWNIEDEHFEHGLYCGPGTTPSQHEAEKHLFDAMKAMTLEERASALAIHGRFPERRMREVMADVVVTPAMLEAVRDEYPSEVGDCGACWGVDLNTYAEKIYRLMEAARRIEGRSGPVPEASKVKND